MTISSIFRQEGIISQLKSRPRKNSSASWSGSFFLCVLDWEKTLF